MAIWRLPVNLQWTGPGSPGANVWHFRTDSPDPTDLEVNAAVAAIHQFYQTLINNNIYSPSVLISSESAVEVSSQEERAVDFDPIAPGSGGTEAPEVLQIVCGWRTSIAARRGRGRTFVGPLATSTMDPNGSVANIPRQVVLDAATALVAASSTEAGWAIGVYGLQDSGGGPTAPRVLRDFTGVKVRDRFAVLRSRRD